jgi:FkbM family methyltransferase
VKRFLKRLRASQPFNCVATTLARAALRAGQVQPEFVVRHLHRVGTVKCPLPNGQTLRLWSRGDDWISNQLFWRGLEGYEPETIPVFLRLATNARLTVDVGAYVGLYALLAALSNREGRVYAFEPHPGIHERLVRNVRLNDLANVECLRSAVGLRDSEATLYHVAAGLPSSSSLSLGFMEDKPDLRGSAVTVVALDRFLRDRNVERVDLVKIDTETTEGDVLDGMRPSPRSSLDRVRGPSWQPRRGPRGAAPGAARLRLLSADAGRAAAQGADRG